MYRLCDGVHALRTSGFGSQVEKEGSMHCFLRGGNELWDIAERKLEVEEEEKAKTRWLSPLFCLVFDFGFEKESSASENDCFSDDRLPPPFSAS